MSAVPAVRVLHEGPSARAALHPLRRRILERLVEPTSASEVARALELPRQKVNYHLRLLEKEGLAELVEERRAGNCTERLLRATARAFVIAPDTLGALAPDPADVRDRFSSAYLTAVAARAIQDLGELSAAGEAAGLRVPTLTVETEVRFASPSAQAAFAEELTAALTRLAAKYHDGSAPEGRTFRFFVGGHPARRRPSPIPTSGDAP